MTIIISGLTPIVNAIGLPSSICESFLLGFFRRDFGAAGLMTIQNSITGVQLLVAASSNNSFNSENQRNLVKCEVCGLNLKNVMKLVVKDVQ